MSEPYSVISSDVVDKMLQINRLAPRCAGDQMTYRFVRYLARKDSGYFRHADVIYPEIFLMTFTRALNDVQSGTNSFTGERIPREISGHSSMIYALVARDLPVIADALFSAEFAEEVKAIHTSVREEVRAAMATPPPAKRRTAR